MRNFELNRLVGGYVAECMHNFEHNKLVGRDGGGSSY